MGQRAARNGGVLFSSDSKSLKSGPSPTHPAPAGNFCNLNTYSALGYRRQAEILNY